MMMSHKILKKDNQRTIWHYKRISKFSINPITLKFNLKNTFLLLTLGLIAYSCIRVPVYAQQNGSENWIGKYDFEDVGKRRSRVELIPSVYYVLELSKNKRTVRTNCNFTASGFQTNEEYQCSVKSTGDMLSIYFEKDLIHTSDEDREFVRFKRGQLLFSLIKSQVGKATRYQVQPSGYKIPLLNDKKKAIYFSRTK